MNVSTLLTAGVGLTLASIGSLAGQRDTPQQTTAERKSQTSWMKSAKYGVFFHYLPGGPDYQQVIDSFDVEAFARAMEQAQPDYVCITLGQNNGYYCSPNAAYEKYVGAAPYARCSRRDLPLELANALSRRHIRLMLYLPSRAPQQDSHAMQELGDIGEQDPAPQEFTGKWSDVIREWSLRYGKRVSGWWFDGAYNTEGWDDLTQTRNWNTWADACRAGNPQSLLAFNPGTDVKRAFTALCEQQNYSAGEQNEWTATPARFPAPHGLQWQILSFLGSSWAQADGPKLSDADMITYIRKVNSEGGVVTMDVHVAPNGKVYEPHLKQLIAIRRALRTLNKPLVP